MADVLPPHGISSKSMDELAATLREDDDDDNNVDHCNKQPRNGDDGKDYSHEEGEEQEHEGPPPPMRTVETTNSNFSVQHIGDVEEAGPSLQDYPEVTYDKATPLFTAIEHTKWREAYQLAKEFPHQITTWVVCQNNELQPSLEFSLWRRLPLHEVRRDIGIVLIRLHVSQKLSHILVLFSYLLYRHVVVKHRLGWSLS